MHVTQPNITVHNTQADWAQTDAVLLCLQFNNCYLFMGLSI